MYGFILVFYRNCL